VKSRRWSCSDRPRRTTTMRPGHGLCATSAEAHTPSSSDENYGLRRMHREPRKTGLQINEKWVWPGSK
jgi:hypothetical protein